MSFYSGTIERGAEVFIHELASHLGLHHKVILIQAGSNTRLRTTYQTKVIRMAVNWETCGRKLSIRDRIFADYWSRSIGKFTMRALKELDQADIVVPVDGGWESLLARLRTWKSGANMVVTGHSGMGWDDRVNLFAHPNVFVALSNFQANWARKNGFGVKVVKIPNGVDLIKFSPSTKNKQIKLPGPIILCVGALEPNKRIELVIKAVSKMKIGNLVLVGEGSLNKEIYRLGRGLLGERFKHIPHVAHNEMIPFYRSANVFTLPTVAWEPFGLVYLEAMASGLPVVAPDDPIRLEIIGNAGMFVNPDNANTYAAVLAKTMVTNWGEKPRLQAVKFSWEKISSEYEKLFVSLRKK